MARRRAARPLPEAGEKLLGRFTVPVRESMLELRSRVLAIMPRAHEVIVDVGYTVALRYGPDDKMKSAFVYVAGFTQHANLGFLSGAFLNDPDHVLEGDGAAMRHAKFESVEQVARATWLERYLRAAVLTAGLSPNMGDAQTEVRARTGKGKTSRRRAVRPAR
jgi:hypothetical protein